MKKFITFSLCLLLCVVTLGLAGCGKSKKETIDTSIATYGNGGMVATRGDYVYFVNGYNSYTTFDEDNLNTKFNVGGLYRAKLNEDGGFDYDDNGSVVGAEKISSHLVGFESTSIYVFGNHVYYSTPITEVDKDGNLQTSKLEFRRVAIDGGKTTQLYQSKSDADDVDYEFYYADGNVYLVINEDGTLYSIKCTGEVVKQKIDENITSLVLPSDVDDVFTSNGYKNIYYTKTNDDDKIEIYNYNVLQSQPQYKKAVDYKTCELVDYKFGHLYYKASKNGQPGYTLYYRVDATKNAIMNLTSTEEKITKTEYDAFYLLENETSGYIAQTSSKTYYIDYMTDEAYPLVDSKIEIIAIRNSYIYYKSSNDIKRINYYDFKVNGDKTEQSVLTISDLQAYDYDIDDNNLYVYAKSNSNTYLYSIKVSNVLEGEEFEKQLLGVYEDGDAPESEE